MADYFERQNRVVGTDTAEKIRNCTVLVIGAGSGGNELLKNLVLMGFGKLTIIDFDFIEDSNLSRTTLFKKNDIGKSKALVAAERLKEYSLHENPEIHGIHGNIITDVGPGIFSCHDIVVCCVDTMKARAYINDWCVRFQKPFFEMGFDNLNVDISFFDPSGKDAPCLREIIGQSDFSGKRNSCSGLKIKDTSLQHIPTIQVASAMAGVLIATEIIKFIQGKASLQNRLLQYYGLTHRMNVIEIDRSPECLIHKEIMPPVTRLPLNNQMVTEDFFSDVNEKWKDFFVLTLPDRFVLTGFCEGCGKMITFRKKISVIFDEERWCTECREYRSSGYPGNWEIISEVHGMIKNKKILKSRLADIGICPLDILTLKGIQSDPMRIIDVMID